eukprot:SAG22_NODE_13557_length_402_cov_1.009901_1_plen_123_part_10
MSSIIPGCITKRPGADLPAHPPVECLMPVCCLEMTTLRLVTWQAAARSAARASLLVEIDWSLHRPKQLLIKLLLGGGGSLHGVEREVATQGIGIAIGIAVGINRSPIPAVIPRRQRLSDLPV